MGNRKGLTLSTLTLSTTRDWQGFRDRTRPIAVDRAVGRFREGAVAAGRPEWLASERSAAMINHLASIARTIRIVPAGEHVAESCFGLGCRLRGSCWRYLAVELVAAGSTTRASCLHDGGYPRYVPLAAERG